jgi:hypothetical protein
MSNLGNLRFRRGLPSGGRWDVSPTPTMDPHCRLDKRRDLLFKMMLRSVREQAPTVKIVTQSDQC